MINPASNAAARTSVFLAAAAFASLLFINACGLFYQCGCEAWWAGGSAHCNIHNAAGPHCPWCLDGGARGGIVYGLVLAVQAVIAFRRGKAGWLKRLGLALLAFPVIGGLSALVFGLATGYWS